MAQERRTTLYQNMAKAFRMKAGGSMSMRIRLYVLVLAVVAVMILGVVIAVLIASRLSAGYTGAERYTERKIAEIRRDLTSQLGDTAVQLISLSQSLSKSIEYQLSAKRISADRLQAHPEILEELLDGELGRLQLAMEKTRSSGVFMLLDATVNPALENAEHSKAGLYLRDSEPKTQETSGSTWLYLRGFPAIAWENGLMIQTVWDMEFDVRDRDYYHLPMDNSRDGSLPLSRLYRWSMESIIPGMGEAPLVCSIPLLDADGYAFGLCGFEISDWNFKFHHSLEGEEYFDAFCMFGQSPDENTPPQGSVLFSGKQNLPGSAAPLLASRAERLNRYQTVNGKEYVGQHQEVRMYPEGSPFAGQHFALSLLIPKEQIDASVKQANMTLILICLAFLACGAFVSVVASNMFLKPITSALAAIHSGNQDDVERTNIQEIDELLAQIREMRSPKSPAPDNLFEDFIRRVKTLTPAETQVFRCFCEGAEVNEMLNLLFISANTLKFHYKNIYAKLNISSKEELKLYIELIRKSGIDAGFFE
jgi:DNA-binding CsgD family transcriptional regulator